MKSIVVFAIPLLLAFSGPASSDIWVKGNTHAHTTESDGDSPPETVADWYKSHGYNFLMLSDHDRLTDPTKYDTDPNDSFILITGEEISASFEKRPVHVNGLGIKKAIAPLAGTSLVDTIKRNVEAVIEDGGIAQINHPNFHYAFNHRELLQLDRPVLLEVYNGHPAVNNAGNAAHMSVEQILDILLSAGKKVFAVATDDAHHFQKTDAKLANPGRGWIVVLVPRLSAAEVMKGIERGRFYASTGVELSKCTFDGKTFSLQIRPEEGQNYLTRFIGLHGQILAEVEGAEPAYRLKGIPAEAYVRAKVISSGGAVAWTQPARTYAAGD